MKSLSYDSNNRFETKCMNKTFRVYLQVEQKTSNFFKYESPSRRKTCNHGAHEQAHNCTVNRRRKKNSSRQLNPFFRPKLMIL